MKRHRKTRIPSRPAEPGDDIPTAEIVEDSPAPLESQMQELARRLASFQARIVLLENELKQARKDSADAAARAAALAKKLADLAPALKRLASFEAGVATLDRKVSESSNRNREEIRQSLDSQRRVIFSELEAFRNSAGGSAKDNPELVSMLKKVLEQLDQVTARNSEAVRRVEALEKDKGPAKGEVETPAATEPPEASS